MLHACVLGGTGLLGRAVALRLAQAGWSVTVTGRDPDRMPPELLAAGVRFVRSDRRDPVEVAEVLAPGADLLVDALCFTAADARSLLPHPPGLGGAVVFSSKAVYEDARGRHINSPERPDFGAAIREDTLTLEPAWDGLYQSREGYGRNKVAAERVLLESGHRISVLRASKVHGVGAAVPREWHFVRRVLDARPVVLLAHEGKGFDHPTAAINAAELVRVVGENPGRRILNIADPDVPTGLDIARAVATHLGHEWQEVLVEGDRAGWHPWDVVPGIRLDLTAAAELGYRPVGTYAELIGPTIDALAAAGPEAPWHTEFDASDFDYSAEDAFLAR